MMIVMMAAPLREMTMCFIISMSSWAPLLTWGERIESGIVYGLVSRTYQIQRFRNQGTAAPRRQGHIVPGGIRKHWVSAVKVHVEKQHTISSLWLAYMHTTSSSLSAHPPTTITTAHYLILLLHAFSLKKKEGVPGWTDVEISAGCLWIITLPLSLSLLSILPRASI